MITIKLVHPTLGIVQEKQSLRCYTQQLKDQWKFRYGKKFKECRIEIEGQSERKDYVKKKGNGAIQIGGRNYISHSRINNYG